MCHWLLWLTSYCLNKSKIRDVQSWAPTPNTYAHDPPHPYTTSHFVLEWIYYIINDNWLHLTLSENTYHTQWPVFEHHVSNTFTHISCLWFYVLCFNQKWPSKRQQHSCTVTYLAFLLFNKLIIYKSAPLWQKLAPYTLLGNMQILCLTTFALFICSVSLQWPFKSCLI